MEEANKKHARELAEVKEGWKRAKETHEREINEGLSAMLKGQSIVPSTFTKKLKATRDYDWSLDPTWHSVKTGEIFDTDGISRREQWRSGSSQIEHDCYLATNSSGKLAFVYKGYTDFC